MTRVLAISGSLRSASTNTMLLRVAAELAPADVEVVLYEGVGRLPHFNPDLDRVLEDPKLPLGVRELRAEVGRADAILISTPEYAHGVPGSLKNALDWLVGGSEFVDMPVALLNASPRSTHAQASLTETLRTMSAAVVAGSPFLAPPPGKAIDAGAAAADEVVSGPVKAALTALCQAAHARGRRRDEGRLGRQLDGVEA